MPTFEESHIVHFRTDVPSLGMIERSTTEDVHETIDNLSIYLHNPENFRAIVHMATEAAREKPIHTLYELPGHALEAGQRIASLQALRDTNARRVIDVQFSPDDYDMGHLEVLAEILLRNNLGIQRHYPDTNLKFTEAILQTAEEHGEDVTLMLQNIHFLPENTRRLLLPRLNSLVDKSLGEVRQKSLVKVELIATAEENKLPDKTNWMTLFRRPEDTKIQISERKAAITAEYMRDAIDMLKGVGTVDIMRPGRSGKSTIAAILRNRSQDSIFVINADQLLKESEDGKKLKWPKPRKGQVVFVDKAELLTLSDEEWKRKETEYGAVIRLWTTNHEDDITFGQ